MHQFSSHISRKITLITKKMTSNNVNTTHNMFLGQWPHEHCLHTCPCTHDTNWKYEKKWQPNQLKDNIRGGYNHIWEGACGQH